jgi:hypothetical protein
MGKTKNYVLLEKNGKELVSAPKNKPEWMPDKINKPK